MQARLIAWSVLALLVVAVMKMDFKFGMSALPMATVKSPVIDMLPSDPAGCREKGC